MAASNLGYAFREVGHHFKRNWTTVLGAVVTIFLSLFIIGLFVLGTVLVNNLIGSVEDQVTIQIFLSDSAAQNDVDAYAATVLSWDEVESVTYKSKAQALEEYRTSMSNRDAPDAVAALDGENPLPASLVIRLTDPQQVEATANRIIEDSAFQNIADDPENPAGDVQYGRETVDRLFSVANYLRFGAAILVALLTFVAFVFINNTIRLAITARRREIGIMRLVGASNGFIRGPFLWEGVLEAVLGALLAMILLMVGIHFLVPALAQSMPFFSFHISFQVLVFTCLLLLGIGIVIGLFGSAIAMRRYLKV